jgi:pantoate--beta-alanine ligase
LAVRTITSIRSMQRLASRWRREGARIGFVPTMGYLHDGHLSLVQRARLAAGRSGRVVLSIYVNPTQFGPGEDLKKYPRDLSRDLRLCRKEGVDAVFIPDDGDMYAGGFEPAEDSARAFSTYIVEDRLSQGMEGASRPTHFRGVTTVIAKLFNIVQPDTAVFGAKDYQQAAVVRRMVRDLNLPVKIIVAPTRREPDGLAMSSRNKYLAGDLRREALVLSEAIHTARRLVSRARRGVATRRLKQRLQKIIEAAPDARVDYIECFDPETLEPLSQARRGTHLALAVFIGRTRLIDNARL